MKAVVTGGCGFIGRELVNRLLGSGWQVVVYDNFSGYQPDNLGKAKEAVTVVSGDVLDLLKLRGVVKDADVVFHLAAYSRRSGAPDGPDLYFGPNSLGSYNVAEACRGTATRVIFASTFIVYEKKGIGPRTKVKETHPTAPTSSYSLSKRNGEEWFELYNRSTGLDTLVFRFSNVFGPGDKGRLIPILIDRARQNAPIAIFGNPRTANFVHVQDVVTALVAGASASKLRKRILNLGVKESINLKKLAQSIVNETGSSSEIGVKPLGQGEFRYYCPDVSLAKREIGFEAKRDVLGSVAELVGSSR